MKLKEEIKMKKNIKSARKYLKEPYTRILIPDSSTGTYTAEILEFPGCIAEGENPVEALKKLENAAEGWIDAAIELGQEIPTPSIVQGFGGKIVLRVPKSLHRQLARICEREKTSMNQFALSAISEKIGATNTYYALIDRMEQKLHLLMLSSTSSSETYANIKKLAQTSMEQKFVPRLSITSVANN